LAKYELPAISARAIADRLKARVFSSDWDTADTVHAELSQRLDDWLAQSIDAPDAPEPIVGEFMAIAAMWPEHRD
jgi:hypothetical protein